MNRIIRSMIWFSLLSSFLLPPSSLAKADGGAVRVSEQQGSYRVTVFTAPTPVRAGPVDISVLVQDAATGELAPDVPVTVRVARRGSPGAALRRPATREEATNKLYYAASINLAEPGWYSVEVSLDGPRGKAQVRFELEAAEPLPSWLAVWPWVGWPFLVILVFAIHQLLVRRRPC
jgi:hypothetical protein